MGICLREQANDPPTNYDPPDANDITVAGDGTQNLGNDTSNSIFGASVVGDVIGMLDVDNDKVLFSRNGSIAGSGS